MPGVIVDGTEPYYDIRGTGPPRPAGQGGDGEGGHFDAFAKALVNQRTGLGPRRDIHHNQGARTDGDHPSGLHPA
jgi:hypothetical protein